MTAAVGIVYGRQSESAPALWNAPSEPAFSLEVYYFSWEGRTVLGGAWWIRGKEVMD
jgi:hypothetical protein